MCKGSLTSLKLSQHASRTLFREQTSVHDWLVAFSVETHHFLKCLLASSRLFFSSNEMAWARWAPPGWWPPTCFRRLFLRNALLVCRDKRTNTAHASVSNILWSHSITFLTGESNVALCSLQRNEIWPLSQNRMLISKLTKLRKFEAESTQARTLLALFAISARTKKMKH